MRAPRVADAAASFLVTDILADDNARVRTFGWSSALTTRGFAEAETVLTANLTGLVLGIAMCLFMMVFLPLDTWLRLAAWTAIGLAIYYLYSVKHAKPPRFTIAAE